jgi:type I restriction enzyme S subunit
MSEWIQKKLTDLGKLGRGKSKNRPRDASHLYGGIYPFIQTGDIKAANHKVFSYSQTYSDAGLAQSKLWPKGTVCITIAANIADSAMLSFPACFPDSVLGFIPDEEKCDGEFIEYLLQYYQKEIKTHSIGSVQENINLGTFEKVYFKIPPLPTQKAISEILSSLDDKIELNNQINQNLEALAQALFKQWFVDFEFPNEKGEPYKSSGGEMVESELGEIPKGWKIDFLTKVLNVVYGKNLPTTNLTPDGFPVFGGNGIIGYYSKFHYEKSQVLISCRGAASGKINFSKPRSFITNNSLVIEISDGSNISFEFLRQWSLNQDFTSFVSGSAQPQITIENLKPLQLLIPSNDILEDFKKIIEPFLIQIEELDKENIELNNLRDTLLPKLISGELEVNESLLEQTF